MEKKTIREMFEQIKANYNLTPEEVEFIDGRIAKLAKSNKSGAETPKHKALGAEAERAAGILTEAGETMSAKDLAAAMEVTNNADTNFFFISVLL